MTITGGNNPSVAAGGIVNGGTLTLSNSTVTGNHGANGTNAEASGGGISNSRAAR